MLGALGLRGYRGDANLLFSFTGHAADLVLATGSIDQTENYVFAVEPQGVGRSLGKASHYWISANDFDTMYTLFNPTDKAQDFDITIHYGDGSGTYQMPLHLEAQASTMIDMMMLIGERRPDVKGNVIPPRIQQGSLVIESAKGMAHWMTLVVSGAVYNARRGTCGVVCTNCYGYTGPAVFANPFAVAVQATVNLYAQATYANGIVQDFTTSSSWTSNNQPVAVVGSATGLVTANSVGSVTMFAALPTLVACTCLTCDPSLAVCPTFAPTPSSGGSVLSVSQSPSSPPSVNMSSGDTNQITVMVNGSTNLAVTTSFTGTTTSNNPNSSCTGSLNIPGGSGNTGSGGSVNIASNVTVSNPGCASPSGVFSAVTASSNGVTSSQRTAYNVPPQILIQEINGEAGGQNTYAKTAVGRVPANRIQSFYYPGQTTYQAIIVPGQFAPSSIASGVQPELDIATGIYSVITPDNTCGSLAFWSPDINTPGTPQWTAVQQAIASGTTTFPSGTGAPTFRYTEQIIYISAVGNRGNGAPFFLFIRPRAATDPAAVQLVCQ